MPRTLPWLKASTTTTTTTSRTTPKPTRPAPAPRSPKRRRLSTPPSDPADLSLSTDLNTTGVSTPHRRVLHLTPTHSRLRKPTRTPSTSPPPAPPDQEPMRAGYANDDVWIMVEDEFMETARGYTSHLHHAEYQRLKALAKAREVRDAGIARPVALRVVEGRGRKVGMALGEGRGEGEGESDVEEDDPWLRDERLAGLMMGSPRKEARVLRGLGAGRAKTRAAAGLGVSSQVELANPPMDKEETAGESRRRKVQDVPLKARPGDRSHDEEDDEDDDLDAPVRPKPVPANRRPVTAPQPPTASLARRERAGSPSKTNVFKAFAKPAAPTPESGEVARKPEPSQRSKASSIPFADFDDFPQRSKESMEAAALLAKRKADRARKGQERAREQEHMREKGKEKRRGSDAFSEIPTFLF